MPNLGDDCPVTSDAVDDGTVRLTGLAPAGVALLRAPLSFRYRYLLDTPTPWREIEWRPADSESGAVNLHADISLTPEPRYKLGLNVTLQPCTYEAAGHTFTGVSLGFKADRRSPHALELELLVPLADASWYCHVQDLYAKKKCCAMDAAWPGLPQTIWQTKRSPFELFTSAHSAQFVRLEAFPVTLQSQAEYVANEGPLFTYRFTLPSGTAWRVPEFSFLATRFAAPLSLEAQKDLWCELFLSESHRFRRAAGVRHEPVLPMANVPIDGGTPGCAPKSKLKIRGTFDECGDAILAQCSEMNCPRLLVGSPWISMRTEGIRAKCTSSITYDSRCGIIEFEVSDRYGGRPAFARFCDKAHAEGVKVFAWYPAFHLANWSKHLTEHPEWIARKADGSPFTYVHFHLTALSPRHEVQKHFIARLVDLRQECGFDGLWLDSYTMSFRTLDYSQKQGVSMTDDAIQMIRKLQRAGFEIINEGYAPFGTRGDGETMFFAGQEETAVETSLFTYWHNTGKVIASGSFFRLLANKAPLTLATEHIPTRRRPRVAAWNRIYNDVHTLMQHRTLLPDDVGVLWRDDGDRSVLFVYQNSEYRLAKGSCATDLVAGNQRRLRGTIDVRRGHIYLIEPST